MRDPVTETNESTAALPGLMMDFPLTVQLILRRMADVHGGSKVVTVVDPDTGDGVESAFRDVVARAGQLANALHRRGVRPGDRVASLAWNTTQHLEVYLAVMSMGAVLHTMNLRLHGDQLAYTAEHAGDVVVLVESSLVEQLAEVLPSLPMVRDVIVLDEIHEARSHVPTAVDYEELLAVEASDFDWPDIDENSAAALCYTSGTTGDPKGVLYSHRSIVLHALSMSGADAYGLSRRDRVLALVPLFHAMGWGLPFVCGLVGSDIVLPGRHVRPAVIARLIDEREVTWSAGVPTVWLDLLHHVHASELGGTARFSSLHTILCGGTAVPESLVRAYRDEFGAEMIEGWGMTEIFPGATVGRDQSAEGDSREATVRRSAGRVSALYELRVIDPADGAVLPRNGVAVGDVEVRGPAVARAYFDAPAATREAIHDGWLRTGDVGTIDDSGNLRITDRAKDVIKSGGEWISSQDLETALMAHPAVREAAVIGVPDERWGERPFAFVVLDAPATTEELTQFLTTRVARWWLPDAYRVIDSIERTASGKFDKRALRGRVDA